MSSVGTKERMVQIRAPRVIFNARRGGSAVLKEPLRKEKNVIKWMQEWVFENLLSQAVLLKQPTHTQVTGGDKVIGGIHRLEVKVASEHVRYVTTHPLQGLCI